MEAWRTGSDAKVGNGGPPEDRLQGRYDVFLSYNRMDGAAVDGLAERLRRAGLEPWYDRWNATPGRRWQQEIPEGLAASASCAVIVGPESVGDWEREEVDIALDQAAHDGDFRVFLVLLPGVPDPFDPSALSPFLSSRTWVDMRGGIHLETAFQGLVNAIKGVPFGPVVHAPQPDERPPYLGLRTFDEENADLFYGRDAALQRLLERLKQSRLLAVLGASGSGKSSLVRAGLMPALHKGALPGSERWPVALFTPGVHPLEELAAQLVRLHPAEGMRRTIEDLGADDRTLHHSSTLALSGRPQGEQVVWVVDQAEEVFTLTRDEQERARFLANLAYAGSAPGGRCIVVLTMRADFYPRCAAYRDFSQLLAHNQTLVGAMTADELREVIERPLRPRLELEAGLTDTVIRDVGNEPGALPLLSHTLLELWTRRRGRMLTLEGYQETGGVAGAIAQRADEVFAGLSPGEQRATREVLLRLTQPGEGTEDTRRRALFSELVTVGSADEVGRVVAELADARLLTTNRADRTDDRWVEVAHEALIRGWPRLRGWIEEDRAALRVHRHLTEAAQEWERLGHDEGMLYRTARLAEAMELRERLALNESEQRFLDDSLRLQQRAAQEAESRRLQELEQARRLARARGRGRIGLGVAIVVLVAAVIGLSTAFNDAREQRDEAQRQERQADSRRLAATAVSKRATDPELSLLLAIEAIRTLPNPETLEALRGALRSWPLREKFATRGQPSEVRFSPNGDTVAATTPGGLALYAAATGDERARVELRKPLSSDFSPSGRRIVSTGDQWALLTDARTGKPAGEVRGDVLGASFAGERALALLARGDGVVLRDVGSGDEVLRVPRVHELGAEGGAVSPTGRTIVTWSYREARLWDVASGRPVGPLLRIPNYAKEGFFSPDGSHVAIVDDQVRIWPTSAPVVSAGVVKGKIAVDAAEFSPDSRRLAVGSFGRTDIWDVRRGRRLHQLSHDGAVEHVAFSRDGGELLTGGRSDPLRVWDVAAGRQQMQLPTQGEVAAVDLAADGRSAVAAAVDGPTVSWSTSRETRSTPLRAGPARWKSAYFDLEGRLAVVGDQRGTAAVWNAADGRLLARVRSPDGTGVSAGFNDDATRLATLSAAGEAVVWDWRERRDLARFRGLEDTSYFDLGPSGDLLLTGAKDGATSLLQVGRQGAGTRLSGHRDQILFADITGDGGHVVTVADGEAPRVWDAPEGRPLGRLGPDDRPAYGGAVSADGRRTAIVGPQSLRVWDTDSRQPVTDELAVPTYSTNLPRLSDDGSVLVAFDARSQAWIWNVDERTPERFSLPDSKYATVSGDGRYAFTSTPQGTVQAWDTADGRLVTTLSGSIDPGSPLEASHDGSKLLVIHRGAVRLLACDLCRDRTSLLRLAEQRGSRELTEVERRRYLE